MSSKWTYHISPKLLYEYAGKYQKEKSESQITNDKEYDNMKINVHFPTTEEGREILEDRIAQAHAEAIVNIINGLDWSYEDKVLLLEKVKEKLNEGE